MQIELIINSDNIIGSKGSDSAIKLSLRATNKT